MREIPIIEVSVEDDEDSRMRVLCTREDLAVCEVSDWLFDWMSDPDDDELEQELMRLRSLTTLAQVVEWLATVQEAGANATLPLEICTVPIGVLADDELI